MENIVRFYLYNAKKGSTKNSILSKCAELRSEEHGGDPNYNIYAIVDLDLVIKLLEKHRIAYNQLTDNIHSWRYMNNVSWRKDDWVTVWNNYGEIK